MKDINVCMFVGRLTRDAELKATASGVDIASFSLAVNTSEKSGGEWKDKANFFDFALYGRIASSIGSYLRKGVQVAVQAEAQFDTWEKDGQKYSKVKFVVRHLMLLSKQGSSFEDTPVF